MKYFLRFILALCFSYSTCAAADIGTVSCSAANTDGTQFVPNWGEVYVSEDQYSRFVYQWMYWDSSARLQWLATNGDSTFEPDAVFYNYDGTAYSDAPAGYWASDLPSPYVDTQFEDPSTEKAVTIGSGQAVFIASGRVYYTVTRMTNGGGVSSWVKLSAQRGRQVPSGCASTWCSFGCDANNNYFTIPFTDHFVVPGCQQYNWLWYTTVRRAC